MTAAFDSVASGIEVTVLKGRIFMGLDVEPDTLREAADEVSDAQERILDTGQAGPGAELKLTGHRQDSQLSTQSFAPGMTAQSEMYEAFGRFGSTNQTMALNCMALASALHIVADVYETADHEEAIEFAFVNPDADIPAGLPFYIDPDMTYNNSIQGDPEAEAELLDQDGGAPDGGLGNRTRIPYHGRVPDGIAEIEHWGRHDEDGNMTEVESRVQYDDGTTHYYTYDLESGESETDFWVGSQPDAPSINDQIEAAEQDALGPGNSLSDLTD